MTVTWSTHCKAMTARPPHSVPQPDCRSQLAGEPPETTTRSPAGWLLRPNLAIPPPFGTLSCSGQRRILGPYHKSGLRKGDQTLLNLHDGRILEPTAFRPATAPTHQAMANPCLRPGRRHVSSAHQPQAAPAGFRRPASQTRPAPTKSNVMDRKSVRIVGIQVKRWLTNFAQQVTVVSRCTAQSIRVS